MVVASLLLRCSLLFLVWLTPTLGDNSAQGNKNHDQPQPKNKWKFWNTLPQVLVIGDSISFGYMPHLKQLLQDRAVVWHPAENCGDTRYGKKKIRKWLQIRDQWAVIHFNFGHHDLKYTNDRGELRNKNERGAKQVVPAHEYAINLRDMVGIMQGTGAKLIWRSTTPIHGAAPGRMDKDVREYNDVAHAIMRANNVVVDDAYNYTWDRRELLIFNNDVHFTTLGKEILARHAAFRILAALNLTHAKRPQSSAETWQGHVERPWQGAVEKRNILPPPAQQQSGTDASRGRVEKRNVLPPPGQ